MSRTFAYARVSTTDQNPENQVSEIRASMVGRDVQGTRIVRESISGSVAAMERPGFVKLLDRLESGDVLIVTKMDRLGRNAMDVTATVAMLKDRGIRVTCLQLGDMDLTTAAGGLTMDLLGRVAQFERDLLIERTNAGIKQAKDDGVKFGRPSALNEEQCNAVRVALNGGASVSQVAKDFKTSRMTIMRIRDRA